MNYLKSIYSSVFGSNLQYGAETTVGDEESNIGSDQQPVTVTIDVDQPTVQPVVQSTVQSTVQPVVNKERQTREELITMYGSGFTTSGPDGGFFAHSYNEDCFLMAGNRHRYTERMNWHLNGKYVVAYLDGNTVIKTFN